MSRARARAIEYARVQSEIRRNDAEAKKMEAEAEYFNRSWKRIIIKIVFTALISASLLVAFGLDTFKNLHDIRSKEIQRLEDEKNNIQNSILEFNKKLLKDLSLFDQDIAINTEVLEVLEMEIDTYSTLFTIKNNKEYSYKDFIEISKNYKRAHINVKEQIKRIKKTEGDIRNNIQMELNKIKKSLTDND